jgi:N-succinyldiaminopimelate aminotransferase
VLNSPLNPAGKVFDDDELSFIAGLLERHDAYAVCDEVYEHLVFDGQKHRPLISLPGMRQRCLRIGSAGKTFSATGWKVGYVTGSPSLIDAAARAHQFLTFTTPPNLQKAVALGLRQDDCYFADLAAAQASKRDRLTAGLSHAGFAVLPSAGSYFLIAGYRGLGVDLGDEAFCRDLTIKAGVTAIPLSAFYAGRGPQGFVRFCFCKRDEVLDEAIRRLLTYFQGETAGTGGRFRA